MSKYISGVILYDETIRQNAKDGMPLVKLIEKTGAIPGIKVDKGTKPLPFSPGEVITEGLDGLRERLAEYRGLGAKFAKWRAVIDIGPQIPSYAAIMTNAHALARALDAPDRPLAAIVGGAKVSTKLDLLGNLLRKVDLLVIGGGMANTFLAAQDKAVGKSLCEHDLLPTAREIMMEAKAEHREIVLPVDAMVAKKFEANAPSRAVPLDGVGPDEMILDIGPRSIEHVCSVLPRAKTLVWNGPLGAFEIEPFDNGTIEVAEAAAELTAAGKLVSVAGGGDTVAALSAAGAIERFTYVSTAGGAVLEWLEGKTLPGVEALRVSQG